MTFAFLMTKGDSSILKTLDCFSCSVWAPTHFKCWAPKVSRRPASGGCGNDILVLSCQVSVSKQSSDTLGSPGLEGQNFHPAFHTNQNEDMTHVQARQSPDWFLIVLKHKTKPKKKKTFKAKFVLLQSGEKVEITLGRHSCVWALTPAPIWWSGLASWHHRLPMTYYTTKEWEIHLGVLFSLGLQTCSCSSVPFCLLLHFAPPKTNASALTSNAWPPPHTHTHAERRRPLKQSWKPKAVVWMCYTIKWLEWIFIRHPNVEQMFISFHATNKKKQITFT